MIALHTLIALSVVGRLPDRTMGNEWRLVSYNKRRQREMASLTLRNIDESLKANLRMVAAANGRSMEEEARQILKQFLLQRRCSTGIGSRISKRFSEAGGVVLPDIARSSPRLPQGTPLDRAK